MLTHAALLEETAGKREGWSQPSMKLLNREWPLRPLSDSGRVMSVSPSDFHRPGVPQGSGPQPESKLFKDPGCTGPLGTRAQRYSGSPSPRKRLLTREQDWPLTVLLTDQLQFRGVLT